MPGTNDIGAHGVNKSVKNYVKLIKRIKAVSDADIYIRPVLPMCKKTRSVFSITPTLKNSTKKYMNRAAKLNSSFFCSQRCINSADILCMLLGYTLRTPYSPRYSSYVNPLSYTAVARSTPKYRMCQGS